MTVPLNKTLVNFHTATKSIKIKLQLKLHYHPHHTSSLTYFGTLNANCSLHHEQLLTNKDKNRHRRVWTNADMKTWKHKTWNYLHLSYDCLSLRQHFSPWTSHHWHASEEPPVSHPAVTVPAHMAIQLFFSFHSRDDMNSKTVASNFHLCLTMHIRVFAITIEKWEVKNKAPSFTNISQGYRDNPMMIQRDACSDLQLTSHIYPNSTYSFI